MTLAHRDFKVVYIELPNMEEKIWQKSIVRVVRLGGDAQRDTKVPEYVRLVHFLQLGLEKTCFWNHDDCFQVSFANLLCSKNICHKILLFLNNLHILLHLYNIDIYFVNSIINCI